MPSSRNACRHFLAYTLDLQVVLSVTNGIVCFAVMLLPLSAGKSWTSPIRADNDFTPRACACAHACVRVCVRVCIFVCVCVFACVFTCVYECVCTLNWLKLVWRQKSRNKIYHFIKCDKSFFWDYLWNRIHMKHSDTFSEFIKNLLHKKITCCIHCFF